MLHMERLLSMSRSYHCPACGPVLHQNPTVPKAAVAALRWWTGHGYRDPNWWWMDIGLPQYAGAIGILLNGTVPAAGTDNLTRLMDPAGDGTKGAGENLLWQQQVAISREVLRGNVSFVAELFGKMWSHVELETG